MGKIQAVTKKHGLTQEILTYENESMSVNWDFVATFVNNNSNHYRCVTDTREVVDGNWLVIQISLAMLPAIQECILPPV